MKREVVVTLLCLVVAGCGIKPTSTANPPPVTYINTDINTSTDTYTATSPIDAALVSDVSSIVLDAGTGEVRLVSSACGNPYQVPCGSYALYTTTSGVWVLFDLSKLSCAPGVRLDLVAVKVNDSTVLEIGVPWCVPCGLASTSEPYATTCANLGLGRQDYTKCAAIISPRAGGAIMPETCDGIDNDCNGLIDDGTAFSSCQDGGVQYSCVLPTIKSRIGSCQCVPACTNKKCGDDDGCGGFCKTCSLGEVCQAQTVGVPACVATCGGGTCPVGTYCWKDVAGTSNAGCIDKNGCDGKACGYLNGNVVSCKGTCQDGLSCVYGSNSKYSCVCVTECTGKTCGAADGCGGVCKTCASGGSCIQASAGTWSCCVAACAGKQCGAADGCGGICTAVNSKCIAGTSSLTNTTTSTKTTTATTTGTSTGTTCHNMNSCLSFSLGYDKGTGWLIGDATNTCGQSISCQFYPNGSDAVGMVDFVAGGHKDAVSGGLYWFNSTNVQYSCLLPTDPFSCFPK